MASSSISYYDLHLFVCLESPPHGPTQRHTSERKDGIIVRIIYDRVLPGHGGKRRLVSLSCSFSCNYNGLVCRSRNPRNTRRDIAIRAQTAIRPTVQWSNHLGKGRRAYYFSHAWCDSISTCWTPHAHRMVTIPDPIWQERPATPAPASNAQLKPHDWVIIPEHTDRSRPY